MNRIISLVFRASLLPALLVFPMSSAISGDLPRIAVMEFTNKANAGSPWWRDQGLAATQDALDVELIPSRKFRVCDRECVTALMRENNLTLPVAQLPSNELRTAGKLLGVDYLLFGEITEYGETKGAIGHPYVAAVMASIFKVETGEIVWTDEARSEIPHIRFWARNDKSMFDKLMMPAIKQLAASINASNL